MGPRRSTVERLIFAGQVALPGAIVPRRECRALY